MRLNDVYPENPYKDVGSATVPSAPAPSRATRIGDAAGAGRGHRAPKNIERSCKDFLWLTFKVMMTAMATDEPSSRKTRPSLLNRLKSGDEPKAGRIFTPHLWKIGARFCNPSNGLTDTEAGRGGNTKRPSRCPGTCREYRYDPEGVPFQDLQLLNQTSWRIKDQFKKRKHGRKRRRIIRQVTAPGDDDGDHQPRVGHSSGDRFGCGV